MNRSVLLGGGAIVLLVAAVVAFGLRGTRQKPEPAATPSTTGRLGVEELMRSPDEPSGKVVVEGVVSTVVPEAHLLTLIDRKGCGDCGEGSCAPLLLPVRWAGKMPKVEDGVEVSGRVSEEGGKLVFVAEALTSIPPARVLIQ